MLLAAGIGEHAISRTGVGVFPDMPARLACPKFLILTNI